MNTTKPAPETGPVFAYAKKVKIFFIPGNKAAGSGVIINENAKSPMNSGFAAPDKPEVISK